MEYITPGGMAMFNYRFKYKVSLGESHPRAQIIEAKSIMQELDVVATNAKLGVTLPPYLNLKPYCGKTINQEDYPCGSSSTISTAVNLLHGLCNYDRRWLSKVFGYNRRPDFVVSRLHNYWNARIYEHSPMHEFKSVMLESGLITIKERKVCPEESWIYTKDLIDVQPKLSVDMLSGGYAYTLNYKILSTRSSSEKIALAVLLNTMVDQSKSSMLGVPLGAAINTGSPKIIIPSDPSESLSSSEIVDSVTLPTVSNSIELIKSELYHHHPVVLGTVLFDNWNSKGLGVIPLPVLGNNTVIGGHTITLTGYSNEKREFMFQNTLGEAWGEGGFGTIPYDYIANPDLCGDIYSIYM